MHDTMAFGGLGGVTGVYVNLPGVPDQHARVVADQIFIGKRNKIIGVAAFTAAASFLGRFLSPSLRSVNPFYVSPMGAGIAPDVVPEVSMHLESPVPLEEDEPLTFEYADIVASNHAAIVHLSEEAIVPVTGDIRTVLADLTITPVDNVWVNAQLDFVDALENGDYDVVGARVIMAGCVAFRFVPIENSHRPGGLCSVLYSNSDVPEQRKGKMGVWFTFNTNTPPSVDILSTTTPGAGTYHVYLDIIKK